MPENVAKLIKDIAIPPLLPVKQCFPDECMSGEQIVGAIQKQLGEERFRALLKPGQRIGITAGSRGVANIALITKTIVDFVRAQGCRCFVMPAMGSHGGATAAGQLDVLKKYGLTEEYLGCPLEAGMDVAKCGATAAGHDVFVNKLALAADGIIVVGRVKPHTAFTGPFESGIMKMMAVGLGCDYGAMQLHSLGYETFAVNVPAFGRVILDNAPILFAVATVENFYDQTYQITAMAKEEIETLEPQLLQLAKSLMPRLFFDACDVLIVDRIGKNISGAGMDPHVTGTFVTPYAAGGIKAQMVGVLDVTEESNGNIIGCGQADAICRRLWEKADLAEGYPNAIVSNMLSTVKIPIIMSNDREVFQVLIKCAEHIDKENPRLIRLKDTLSLDKIWISPALLAEAKANPNLVVLGPAQPLSFDAAGNLF